jgi:hypothetical protein
MGMILDFQSFMETGRATSPPLSSSFLSLELWECHLSMLISIIVKAPVLNGRLNPFIARTVSAGTLGHLANGREGMLFHIQSMTPGHFIS